VGECGKQISFYKNSQYIPFVRMTYIRVDQGINSIKAFLNVSLLLAVKNRPKSGKRILDSYAEYAI